MLTFVNQIIFMHFLRLSYPLLNYVAQTLISPEKCPNVSPLILFCIYWRVCCENSYSIYTFIGIC